MGKSVTVPGKCYAMSDGDRQDNPRKKEEDLAHFNLKQVQIVQSLAMSFPLTVKFCCQEKCVARVK